MIDAMEKCLAKDPITLLSNTLRCQPNGKELAANMCRQLYIRLQCDAMMQCHKSGTTKFSPRHI
jgi:hypothetical protein